MKENTMLNSSYVILSGFFANKDEDIDNNLLNKDFYEWQNRIFDGDYKSTFQYLKSSYYSNYLNNIFPEVNEPSSAKRKQFDLLEHYTFKDIVENRDNYKGIEVSINPKKKALFDIDFIDLYLFPHGIGIFSIKVQLQSNYQNIIDASDFFNAIRMLHTSIRLPNDKSEVTLKSFVEKRVLKSIELSADWDSYNPQLKSYIQIDIEGSMTSEERNHLIYDIGNISPLGSAEGKGFLAPSPEYYEQQISENLISVFNNWSALTLFDTFTRISNDFPDRFKSWEYDYFNVYIHTLYSKFFLYLTSSKLSDVTVVNKATADIRDEFIEFINDEFHSHVSYKFLPNMIVEKLHNSLGVNVEVDKMETKVLRINEYFKEKREKTLNIAISVIAFLSVFSSLYDFSEWGISVGYPRELMFPYTSITIGLVIFGAIFFILRKNIQK